MTTTRPSSRPSKASPRRPAASTPWSGCSVETASIATTSQASTARPADRPGKLSCRRRPRRPAAATRPRPRENRCRFVTLPRPAGWLAAGPVACLDRTRGPTVPGLREGRPTLGAACFSPEALERFHDDRQEDPAALFRWNAHLRGRGRVWLGCRSGTQTAMSESVLPHHLLHAGV